VNIAIVGQGTAGIMSLCHFLYYSDFNVTSYYSPNKKSLGIGESTNSSFVNLLQKSIDFDLINDLSQLDGTIKLGTVYKNWREQTINNPLLDGSVAMHFDTNLLADFVIDKLKYIYGERLTVIEEEVDVSNIKNKYDFVINCTGFPKDFDKYQIVNLPINSCVVKNIDIAGDWNYTGHRAEKNGWVFEIPLTTRQSYGYLYNDTLNTEQEILSELNIQEASAVYKFQPYYKKHILEDNVFFNGNAAIFYEPMAATSLWMYDNVNRIAHDYMHGIYSEQQANTVFQLTSVDTENIIKMFYYGGSNYDSDFWSLAVDYSQSTLKNHPMFINLQNKEIPEEGWVFNKWFLHRVADNFGYYKSND